MRRYASRPLSTEAREGIDPPTVEPAPGDESTTSDPLSVSTRSFIPWSPVPRGVRSGSNPVPSSVTSNVTVPSRSASRTRALDAFAYFATFWSASRQQKYTAASTSCG